MAQGGCEGGAEREGRLLGRINHDNVLRPFAVARDSRGEAALVMPRADRGDLAHLLRCARPAPVPVLAPCLQLADRGEFAQLLRCARPARVPVQAPCMRLGDRGDLGQLLRCAPCSCACSGSLHAARRPRRPRPPAEVRALPAQCLRAAGSASLHAPAACIGTRHAGTQVVLLLK